MLVKSEYVFQYSPNLKITLIWICGFETIHEHACVKVYLKYVSVHKIVFITINYALSKFRMLINHLLTFLFVDEPTMFSIINAKIFKTQWLKIIACLFFPEYSAAQPKDLELTGQIQRMSKTVTADMPFKAHGWEFRLECL